MALTSMRNVIEIIKAISRSAKLHSGNETRSSGSREDMHAEIDGEEILRGFLAGARVLPRRASMWQRRRQRLLVDIVESFECFPAGIQPLCSSASLAYSCYIKYIPADTILISDPTDVYIKKSDAIFTVEKNKIEANITIYISFLHQLHLSQAS